MGVSSENILFDVGKRLAQLRLNKDSLVKLLRQAASALSELSQSPSLKSVIDPINDLLVQHNLLQHKDKDVRLLVAVCLSEIIRILAPDPPYNDEILKDIFNLIISIFGELADTTSPYFSRRVKILETVAALKCCVLMLDIGCEDLILELFNVFFSVVREDHPQSVFQCFLSIMTLIFEEKVSQPLLDVILRNLLVEDKSVPCASFRLAVAVIENCTERLEPFVRGFLSASILDRGAVGSDLKEFYHEIIFEIFQCAPQMLLAVIPNLIEELLTDQVDVRIKAVKLVGRLFAFSGRHVAENYRPLFVEFLKRFSDKSVEVRLCAIECAKACYLANSGTNALEVLTALEGRLMDFDDKVRTQVVNVICELAKHNPKSIPSQLILQAAGRLRDKKVSVRKNAMQKLMELYRAYCTKCCEGVLTLSDHFEQIPSRVLRLCYDTDCKEFRPQSMELVLAEDLFPASLCVEERTRHWISLFSFFALPHVKALESILSQKLRLQTEMQEYLAHRQKQKTMLDKDSEEVHQWNSASFLKMSKSFSDPSKVVESFQKLHQMKDNSIFKALLHLLDGGTSFETAQTIRDQFLKRIGDKHPDYEFLRILSAKCSYNIFSAEHVHSILFNYLSSKNEANQAFQKSATDLLLTVVTFFPSLLRGSEDNLLGMLLNEGGPLKEKLLQMLAKAGSHISINLSSIYPSLEQLCLYGTRLQSKYSISAINALTGDSGQLAFSNLYQQLVDSLSAGRDVPTVLQSLGCIAQYSVSLFESREDEITQYIIQDIFKTSNSSHGQTSFSGDPECSHHCKLKIYGLKTLLKSFLPHEGTHTRHRVRGFLNILLKLLQKGDISDDIVSSEIDKAHIRLAAAKSVLRLARKWDLHISPQIFCLTVMRAQDPSYFVRRSFLDKTHKLLKEHAVPIRYACAFALAASDCLRDVQDDSIKYLAAFIEECRREARMLQNCKGKNPEGAEMTNYPEYVIVFLIHVLAHDPDFPSKNCTDDDDYAGFFSPLVALLRALIAPDSADIKKNAFHDNLSYILGLFRVVKRAEDAVDASMTPKLYILSEIGTNVAKALGRSALQSSHTPDHVLLPSLLFKATGDAKSEKPSSQSDNGNVNHLVGSSDDGGVIERALHVLKSHITQPASPSTKRGRKSQEEAISSDVVKHSKNLSLQKRADSLMNKAVEHHERSKPQLNARGKNKRPVSPIDSISEQLPYQRSFDFKNKNGVSKESNPGKVQLSSDGSISTKPSVSASQVSLKDLEYVNFQRNDEKLTFGEIPGELVRFSENNPEAQYCSKLEERENASKKPVGERIKRWSSVSKCFSLGTVDEHYCQNSTQKVTYDNEESGRPCLTNEHWEVISNKSLALKDSTGFSSKDRECQEGRLFSTAKHSNLEEADSSTSRDLGLDASISSLKDANDSSGNKVAQPSALSNKGMGDLSKETVSSIAGTNKGNKRKGLKPPIPASKTSKSKITEDETANAIARRTRSRKT